MKTFKFPHLMKQCIFGKLFFILNGAEGAEIFGTQVLRLWKHSWISEEIPLWIKGNFENPWGNSGFLDDFSSRNCILAKKTER